MVATLQYARSEAAKRNADVSVRARAGSWRFGFEIITNEIDADGVNGCVGIEDIDGSGACNDDAILKVIELGCWDTDPTRGLQITHTALDPAAAPQQDFTYRSSGRINAASVGGVFNICMANFLGTTEEGKPEFPVSADPRLIG